MINGNTANNVAETYGATAEFTVRQNAALVFNNEALSAWLAPVLTEAAGEGIEGIPAALT